ncbi:phosphate acyltransferase PlsX [Actinoplanes sp. NEAU-A12]|uniref:Phosphate acyltransferase n=1 Tax=Actinoplanes sandaracinus TaxID=3045177 RepID=A0ABT6WD77_9ACTN|nr:phosphate acyltransferase PlsX [Actinoplanes sandaracinus]MDI6097670.1 phosphate acyltransferase PlsX [Actinoplanes sandaracinus]
MPERWRTTGAAAPGQRSVGEPGTARIAVDLLGGDQAPAVVVDGALRACKADPSLHLTLVGPAEAADAVLAALKPADRRRITTAITPADTIGGAVLAVAEGRADALVSAGDTRATVLSAARELGRWPGLRRPALAAVVPTAAGRLVLLDVGSTVDPDEETLAWHARLGAAYASVVHRISAPRVGLLTIGTEPGKGDRLRRALPAQLVSLPLPAGARYAGLVEGGDVVLGRAADVVVTDGFTGNVLLKGLETAYALTGPPSRNTDPPARAALLLGVSGTVVVCHGAAAGPDIAAGIALAADLYRRGSVAAIADLLRVQRGIA